MKKNSEFYYQCSKDGSDFLFGNFRIMDSRDEPYFPAKTINFMLIQNKNNVWEKNQQKRET